jgi:hypothetical protein
VAEELPHLSLTEALELWDMEAKRPELDAQEVVEMLEEGLVLDEADVENEARAVREMEEEPEALGVRIVQTEAPAAEVVPGGH